MEAKELLHMNIADCLPDPDLEFGWMTQNEGVRYLAYVTAAGMYADIDSRDMYQSLLDVAAVARFQNVAQTPEVEFILINDVIEHLIRTN